jgi:hypothetical protein
LARYEFANFAHPDTSALGAGALAGDGAGLPDRLVIGFVLLNVVGDGDFPWGRAPNVAFWLGGGTEHDSAATSLLDVTDLEGGVDDADAAALAGDGGVDGDGAVAGKAEHIDGEAGWLELLEAMLLLDGVGHEAAEDVTVE